MEQISTENLYCKFLECSAVVTDTRQIINESMFFALKGPNFNANTLAKEAIEKGAKYAIVDEAVFANNVNIFLVNDGLMALQNLARYHRNQWKIPVIGLTGSNGKTTSKELINVVLAKKYITHATKGNLNNHIGVPLTVLNCPASTQVAIIEMGANHQKEIELLCNICQPTLGLITNVGKAHLEGFGGMAGVIKGKGELYDYLQNNKGTVFVNTSNQILVEMASQRTFHEKIAYQQANSFIEFKLISETPFVQYQSEDGTLTNTHLTGIYNFENIVNALAIGKYLGVNSANANEAIADYEPQNNRSQFVIKGSNHILLDAYNANPSSMAAAIGNFDKLEAEHKMIILGDMFELGEDTKAEHEYLGKQLSNKKFQYILLAGPLMQSALKNLPQALYFPDKHGLHLWLHDHKIQNTHILIKGSRGMGLESCLPFLS